MRWVKIGTREKAGVSTVIYATQGSDLRIESRRRGKESTSWYIVMYGVEICRRYTFADAKIYVERLLRSENNGEEEG